MDNQSDHNSRIILKNQIVRNFGELLEGREREEENGGGGAASQQYPRTVLWCVNLIASRGVRWPGEGSQVAIDIVSQTPTL